MITLRILKASLKKFLDLHWHSSFTHERPVWSKCWTGIGELPNRQLPGCYALLSGQGIEYIGSGIRRGKNGYTDNGLGGRAAATYSRWDKQATLGDGTRIYRFMDGWKGVYTVGFPPELGYLALAFEHFLIIRHGAHLRNKVRMSGGLSG